MRERTKRERTGNKKRNERKGDIPKEQNLTK
jgi:hypothetical protein